MPEAGAGGAAAMRMAAGGGSRGATSGVGAGASGDGGVSEVAGDSAEHGVDRTVPHLEV